MTTPGPDLSVPCLRCSQDAAPHGEHHLEHKGSGGRGPKAPATAHERVPLCRTCHDDHHAEVFDFGKKDGFYVGTKGEFRSPITYDNDSPDKRFWEVDKLTAEWHEVDEAVVDCYKVQCQEAYAIKDRIGWKREWWLQAAKQFSKKDKSPVHWSAVYDRVASWETFELRLGGGAAWDAVLLLGEKGRRAVCAHANPQWALDTAIVMRLAGDTVARVVKLLKVGEVSDEPKNETCEEHDWRCHHCGVAKAGAL